MPKLSGKINQRERAICARLKEFRESIKWAQPDFAKQIGLTKNQLASIEYARTPLRYDVAWRIKTLFGLSLEWLSVGEMSADALWQDELPMPEDTRLAETALLSEVSDKVHGPVPENASRPSKQRSQKVKLDAADTNHRAFMFQFLKGELERWIASVPEGYTKDFGDKLLRLANTYLKALPNEPTPTIEARMDALMWREMGSEIARRIARSKNKGQNTELTNSATSGNVEDMQGKWPALKKQLQAATEKTGKSALAKFLKVDLTRVSQWLTDAKSQREPGAEYALQMQDWLRRQQT